MSWAADRKTSREEDIAYCLLGIFDINMPLVYGEGMKAFTRLQQEIVLVSNDQSLLAWDLLHPTANSATSALAHSPNEFRFAGSIVRNRDMQRRAYSVTNLGISIQLALIETHVSGMVLVGLNCSKELYREVPHTEFPNGVKLHRRFRIWIHLCRITYDTYSRVHHPSSKIFMGKSYATLGNPTPTDLFLSLKSPQPSIEGPTHSLPQNLGGNWNDSISSVLVTVAAGKLSQYGHTMKEVSPLGHFSIVPLKHPGASTMSHQLISCDGRSLIFSVFWNEYFWPHAWLYTVIPDPELQVCSEMARQVQWNCLFETHGHTQSNQCCNSVAAMHSLHKGIYDVYGGSLGPASGVEMDPVVIVESSALKDAFQKPVLIVSVIFQSSRKFAIA
ncbi:hypothetical protein GGS23DRAFT_587605 [Durotheca rogersii]|uniref:uncharacterized protein n=1 Tax=Durotheca rogersii TaxID=419775 RepID=UPI00221E57A4|nr:uncharacterized protein GGS23DRAFT_587605 [Durotheca rogersii]KAI5857478.1 hypothetical protein GGS23DRAFT_587605 [Durotheca rogersii]